MTFHGIMGLIYICDISIAVLAIAIILIMKNQKIISIEGVNRYLLIVLSCLMMINLLYFIIDYYSVIISFYETGMLVRVLDISLAITMQAAWIMMTKELVLKDTAKQLYQTVKFGYLPVMAVSFINYGYIMCDGYFVEDETLRTVSVMMSASVSLFLTAINIICIVLIVGDFRKIKSNTVISRFAITATSIIALDGIQNALLSIKLISGDIELYNFGDDAVNLTAVLRLAFGVCLLWYTIKHCVFEQYQKPPETVMPQNNMMSEEERIEALAEVSQLTERETVVMKLLYAGSTYQDIADYLYLSKNTVRHHVTNIYRKLGVASKMEMINMVRDMGKV